MLFRQGFLTSSANPFAVVFFGALFPQFIDAGAPIWPQLLVLGGTYLLVDGVILILWGALARQTLGRLTWLTGTRINRLSGGLMIAAAALLASAQAQAGARIVMNDVAVLCAVRVLRRWAPAELHPGWCGQKVLSLGPEGVVHNSLSRTLPL